MSTTMKHFDTQKAAGDKAQEIANTGLGKRVSVRVCPISLKFYVEYTTRSGSKKIW